MTATAAVGGGAIAGGGLSLLQAGAQNRAVGDSMDSAFRSAIARRQQLASQAGVAMRQRNEQARQAQGRIRTAFGEGGAAGSGSQLAAMRSVDVANELDQASLGANFTSNIRASDSSYEATIAGLEAQSQNPLLAALGGGLQGAQLALGLYTLGSSLAAPPPTAAGDFATSLGGNAPSQAGLNMWLDTNTTTLPSGVRMFL